VAAPSEAASTAEPTVAAVEAPASVKQEAAGNDTIAATEPVTESGPSATATDAGASAAAPMEDVKPTAAPEVPATPEPAAESTAAQPAPPAAEAFKPEPTAPAAAAAEAAAGPKPSDAALGMSAHERRSQGHIWR